MYPNDRMKEHHVVTVKEYSCHPYNRKQPDGSKVFFVHVKQIIMVTRGVERGEVGVGRWGLSVTKSKARGSHYKWTMFGEITAIRGRSAKGFAAGILVSQMKPAGSCKQSVIRHCLLPLLHFYYISFS